ncbi:hypothetical protein [Parenemella sanctibonifatiensis]|uniref:Uncharacterized protein n=1 Tax=Parenemella sanctibonifatiensis TaxID=2016505 RepID=A0A255ECK0_9ACTN|nr:hypothetical protein [Parenemella sanctibonifatiensis]OYN89284.1 hypothetical protein CGZ92_02915 [Parenemella sanctibonifatiensis]
MTSNIKGRPLPGAANGENNRYQCTADTDQLDHLARLLGRIDAAEQIRRRAVQDAIAQATAKYWIHRAEAFEAIVGGPRVADDPRTTVPDLSRPEWDQDTVAGRSRLAALNCRRHALMLMTGEFSEPWPGFGELLDDVLSEVAA